MTSSTRAQLKEAMDSMVSTLGLHTPTAEQEEIAIYPLTVPTEKGPAPAPLLVVAGAGSGKTATLALRATFVAAHYGVAPEEILGLTFTNKAAGELEQRLRARIQQWGSSKGKLAGSLVLAGSPEVTTYNSFALAIVREFGGRIGFDPQALHLGGAAAWQLMFDVVSTWSGDLPDGSTLGTVVDRAISLRESISNQALRLDQARAALEKLSSELSEEELGPVGRYGLFQKKGAAAVEKRLLLLDVIQEFERRKNDLGRMDYADQVLAAIRVVEEVPEARQSLRERHKVVFLDEFQDTSVAQMRLLAGLFKDHPVTAVGDPNQAIYGWRGASAASLEDFHLEFNSRRDVEDTVLTLSTAWRNDQLILDSANTLVEPFRSTATKGNTSASGNIALPILTTRKGAGKGNVQVDFAADTASSMQSMVDFMRQSIERVQESRSTDSRGRRKPVTAVVLSRTAAPLLVAADALAAVGVPAQLASGDALLLHPAVRDLKAALEISADIGRSTAILHLLTSLDLGVKDLRAVGNLARQESRRHGIRQDALLFEAIQAAYVSKEVPGLSRVGLERVKELARRLNLILGARDRSIVEQVENARWALSLDDQALADPSSIDVGGVLDQFTSLAVTYQGDAEVPTLPAYLEWLRAAEEKERGLRMPNLETDPGVVQLMTIHAAKGLEWDIVALIDMTRGRFPSGGRAVAVQKARETDEIPTSAAMQFGWWTDWGQLPYPVRKDHRHLPSLRAVKEGGTVKKVEEGFKTDVGEHLEQEERRLAYVAVTRPKSHLLLTGEWYSDGTGVRYPSTFLLEVANVEGVRSLIAGIPTDEEIAEIRGVGSSKDFPPPPSIARRKGAQLAARIADSRAELDAIDGEALREVVLARVSDRTLAARTMALLQEQDRAVHERALGAQRKDPRAVLESLAQTQPISVTELARFEADPQGVLPDLLRPVPTEPTTGALVGSAFHQWIESNLRRLMAATDEPDDGEIPVELNSALTPSDRQTLAALQGSFQKSQLVQDLNVVALEAPFWVPNRDLPLRGRIDAVFRKPNGDYLLIDWKTRGSISSKLDALTLRRYITQLRVYRDAWEPRAAEEGVQLESALVFIAHDGVKMVNLDDLQSQLATTASQGSATAVQ